MKSGFVSIIGRPNVGKSTLLNCLIGQKIAITSRKPQTTRKNMKGIITEKDKGQIVFVDTPGLHRPHHTLGESLVKAALGALEDVEVLLLVVDGTEEVGAGDRYIVEKILNNYKNPVFLVINKLDKVNKHEKEKFLTPYKALFPFTKVFLVSAKHGDNLKELTEAIFEYLPERAPFYDEDILTDTITKDIAGEMIREQIFRLFGEEIPHCSAVYINSFTDDLEKNLTRISATIYVEKDSQKGIIIGKAGSKVKEIGENSRKEIEELVGNKVFLELNVKVLKNWREDKKNLKKLGYIVG